MIKKTLKSSQSFGAGSYPYWLRKHSYYTNMGTLLAPKPSKGSKGGPTRIGHPRRKRKMGSRI